MQHFKKKYTNLIITLLIILQVGFLTPFGYTSGYVSSTNGVNVRAVMDIVAESREDITGLTKKELRKAARVERRRLRKEVKAKRKESKVKEKEEKKRKKLDKRKNKRSKDIFLGDSIILPIVDSSKQNKVVVDVIQTDVIKSDLIVSPDSVKLNPNIEQEFVIDSTLNTVQQDSLTGERVKNRKQYIGSILHTKNVDSMVFNVKSNEMLLYNKAEVDYDNNLLNADFMKVQLAINQINAKGVLDSLGVMTRPTYNDGTTPYEMDSMAYNLKTQKANVFNATFKEGEGFIHGKKIKKASDKMMNIKDGKYTTCDCAEPHFYVHLSKAQLNQGKNSKTVVFGPSYLVLEGVPLPLVLPFGLFPVMSDRNSGVIIPEFGDESQKGFFLRGGGYYFAFNDYVDATLLGGIYTLGSWELSAKSSYRKKYKFNGNIGIDYSKDIIGEKGSDDYQNINNYRVSWSHTQDPKFLPSSTFSASVNFSSSTYNKLNGNIDDYITAQTNSTISYSKSWVGKPISFSTNLQHSQNNRDSTVTLSLPNIAFNVSKIYPFKRKEAVGKQLWYEKIGMSYSGTMNNTINTKENLLFKPGMFDNMKYGINHQIPINTSFSILKYLNITPSVNYQERWYFDKISKDWDQESKSVVVTDTTQGFYRVFNYSVALSAQTTLYGMYNVKGDKKIKAVRHMMTPSLSFSYAPDFGDPKYGYYKSIQTSADGTIGEYSPFENGIYGVPGRGQSGNLSFSLGNTLEMKIRSDSDTTGVKKIKLLESLNIGSSYNLLADSMNLAPISLSARTTLFKSLGINMSASLDPYKYTDKGIRTKEYSIGRITSAAVSFGYSFRSVFGHEGEESGTGSETLPRNLTPEENRMAIEAGVNPNAAVSLLTPEYYNFSIPWNLSLNYNFSYSHSGNKKTTTQTVSYNGSLTITKNWGFSFSGGINLNTFEITPGSVSIDRDLHCWQMGLTWVPVGYRKSWSFNIRVKSSILQDLKFDKSSGFLDNYY